MKIEIDPTVELSRKLRLDRVPAGGVELRIEPGETERAALARRFALSAVTSMSATTRLDQGAGGMWRVRGRLLARVVQPCGITLEPVEQAIDDTFDLRFGEAAEELDRATGELVIDADGEAPEPLEGDELDLGAVVADQLGLAIDPFPRKAGARLEDVLPAAREEDPAAGPFGVLRALRRREPDSKGS
ncbi:MAG: DUF177 domain-containing protein [Rhodospirillales bacterium]|nr:MAG: DUF177 domain-containing protein [Rhodospirillales bacterium]